MPWKDPAYTKQYLREYHAKNRDEIKVKRRAYYLKNKARVHEMNRLNKRKYKLEAKMMLGGKCVCCGEAELELLTIDHVHNDGNKFRRENGKYGYADNSPVYYEIRDMIRKGIPVTNYQIMCFNCNISKHFGKGLCVHERNRMRLLTDCAGRAE